MSWTDLLRSLGPHLEGYNVQVPGLEPGSGPGQKLAQGSGRGSGFGVEEEEEDVEVVVGVNLMGGKDDEDDEEEDEVEEEAIVDKVAKSSGSVYSFNRIENREDEQTSGPVVFIIIT